MTPADGLAVAGGCILLVALYLAAIGSRTLDDDLLPLAARLVGGLAGLVGGFVLGLTAVALLVSAASP